MSVIVGITAVFTAKAEFINIHKRNSEILINPRINADCIFSPVLACMTHTISIRTAFYCVTNIIYCLVVFKVMCKMLVFFRKKCRMEIQGNIYILFILYLMQSVSELFSATIYLIVFISPVSPGIIPFSVNNVICPRCPQMQNIGITS